MKLFKSFSIYTGASFLQQAVAFLLLPIFTTYLSKYDYGMLGLINPVIAIVSMFIMIGSGGAIRQRYFVLDSDTFRSFFSNSVFTTFISFLLIFAIFSSFKSSFARITGIIPDWIIWIPVIAFLSILPKIILGLWQVEEQPIKFAIFSVSDTVLNLSLGLLLIVFFGYGFEGRLFGIIASSGLLTVISIIILSKKKLLFHKLSKKWLQSSLNYGFPLIPHAIGAYVVSYSDRFFIEKLVNIEEVGLYTVGYTIGNALGILNGAFVQAYSPFVFKMLKNPSKKNDIKIVRMAYLFILLSIFMLMLLYILTPLIFRYFIGEQFQSSSKYIIWIALGVFFHGLYKIVTVFIFYFEKTKYLMYLSFINVLLNLLLNYYLIYYFGAIGAAYATLISFIVLFLLTSIISYSIYPINWVDKKIFLINEILQ